MSTALRGCSVEFVWCGVLGAFLRMFWRVRVWAPADLPSAQGYRIARVEATTGHCDARSPTLFFYSFFGCFGCGLNAEGRGLLPALRRMHHILFVGSDNLVPGSMKISNH